MTCRRIPEFQSADGAGTVQNHRCIRRQTECAEIRRVAGAICQQVAVPVRSVAPIAARRRNPRAVARGGGGGAGFRRIAARATPAGGGDNVIIRRAIDKTGIGAARASVAGDDRNGLVAGTGAALHRVARGARRSGPRQYHLRIGAHRREARRRHLLTVHAVRGVGRNAGGIHRRDSVIVNGVRAHPVVRVSRLRDALQKHEWAGGTCGAVDGITHRSGYRRPVQRDIRCLDKTGRE